VNKKIIRPANHEFSNILITLLLSIKLTTSASFRSISKIMVLVNLYLDLNIKVPCHVTILLWVKKMGVYKLFQAKEKADDWIIMIDESIEFGHDKLLVILGIRERDIDFSRALQYHDMECLMLKASGSWKGKEIGEVIESLSLQIGPIKYAVADMGNSIKKALRLTSITHVEDVNHKLSWFIKELYKDDKDFNTYTKQLSYLRGVLGFSELSHILPPQQRTHSRYMNLKPVFDWGMAVLGMLEDEKANPLEKEKMLFVKEYEVLIKETCQLVGIANNIQEILKNNGLSEKTKEECLKLFESVTDVRTLKFKGMVNEYLENTVQSVGASNRILCSSDILESSFGKYKNYISDNISVGITDLSLCIAAFGSKLEQEEIKNAMESIKVSRVKEWSTANIGHTQTKKRHESLKMDRRKNAVPANF
jgi:hypothetical protein